MFTDSRCPINQTINLLEKTYDDVTTHDHYTTVDIGRHADD